MVDNVQWFVGVDWARRKAIAFACLMPKEDKWVSTSSRTAEPG